MQAALSTYFGLGGLALDFVGAALLAYDVLYGSEARIQARIRRKRLAIARRSRERLQTQLEALNSANAPEKKVRRLRESIRELRSASDVALTELGELRQHEHRARRIALAGFLLLMGGFAFQVLAHLLANDVVP